MIARVEKQKWDDDGAKQVHDWRSDDGSAYPAHVVAQQLASGVAKFADFEIFHSESFDDTISSGRFLQNLAKVGKASLAVFRGAPDFCGQIFQPE